MTRLFSIHHAAANDTRSRIRENSFGNRIPTQFGRILTNPATWDCVIARRVKYTPPGRLGSVLWLALMMLALAGQKFLAAAERVRPNIVMVFIDDLGWGDFSCFGNALAKTPNIDRLASEGIRFSQFYVNSPICSPSRTALTTGQYPQRWRIGSYLNNRADNEKRGVANWLDPRAPTLARILSQNGYATGHFGKWHMGGQRDVGEAPLITEYGFHESLTNFEGLGPRLLPLCDAHDGLPAKRHALNSDNLGRGPIVWYDRSQITAGFVGAAVEFTKKAVADDRRFYINVWPDDVHSPFFPPAALRGDGSKQTLYRAVLETMDAQLGVLVDHIRSNIKLRDNTLILVCSDNGPEPGAGSAGPFRGSKATLYEGGIRSPLVVWGPGFMDSKTIGVLNDSSVFAAFDLAPSLLTIAGCEIPRSFTFDGESLEDVLVGRSKDSRHKPLFWRRPPDRKTWPQQGLVESLPDLAIRRSEWKLLCDYDGSRGQLYNLDNDPRETTNLVDGRAELVQQLTESLLAWHNSLPPDNGPTYQSSADVTSKKKGAKAQK